MWIYSSRKPLAVLQNLQSQGIVLLFVRELLVSFFIVVVGGFLCI